MIRIGLRKTLVTSWIRFVKSIRNLSLKIMRLNPRNEGTKRTREYDAEEKNSEARIRDAVFSDDESESTKSTKSIVWIKRGPNKRCVLS